MKKIIFQYYLPPFVGLLIVFCLQGLLGESVNSWQENLFIALLFASVIALVTGTLYYLLDTKWGPSKRINMLLKSPFTELQLQGFQSEEDYCWGIVNGYTVFVSFGWHTGSSAIEVNVLFNPRLHGQLLTEEDRKCMHKRNKTTSFWKHAEYEWHTNALGFSMKYNFKPPSWNKVVNKAEEIIRVLQSENLKPATREESEKLMLELREGFQAGVKAQEMKNVAGN